MTAQRAQGLRGDSVPQFRIEARIKNNRLLRAREAKGWTSNELARIAGTSASEVSAYETLKQVPWRQDGAGFKSVALKLAVALGLDPVELWSEDVRHVDPAVRVRELDRADLGPWIGAPQVQKRLETSVISNLVPEPAPPEPCSVAPEASWPDATPSSAPARAAARPRRVKASRKVPPSAGCPSRHPVRGWACTRDPGHPGLHVPWPIDPQARCGQACGHRDQERCRLPREHTETCVPNNGAWL